MSTTSDIAGERERNRPRSALLTFDRAAAVTVVLLVLALALSLAAAGPNVLPGDVAVARAIQDIQFPGDDRLERLGYFIGSFDGIVILGLSMITLLAVTRRFPEAFMLVGALIVRGSNPWIKDVIDSPRPTEDLVRVIEGATGDPNSLGFPSGHVMGSVILYGTLIYIAHVLIRPRWLRLTVQTVAVLAIVITALSRIYSGAHWPTDVLGGTLYGLAILLLVLRSYQSALSYHRRRRARIEGNA